MAADRQVINACDAVDIPETVFVFISYVVEAAEITRLATDASPVQTNRRGHAAYIFLP